MKRLLVFGIFLFLSSFGFVEQTSAANFIVNDATSLIAAINTANSNNQDDIITFDSNIALTVASDFTQGVNGLPSILPDGGSSLTIEGNGFTLSRSGAAAFRIMHITAGANVFINDLTIENGLANASGIGSMGGAIFTWGQITIDNSIFTGNVADDGSSNGLGGAIAPADTTATITNSTFANNSAMRNEGGAILATRVNLTLIGNTFTNNGARDGGGLGIQGGNITLVNNTFSGNTATFQGGGISNSGAILVMRNNTIMNNTAGTSGGGVYNAFFGVMTLHNNIVVGNTAASGSQCFNDTTVGSTFINADSYNIFGTGGNAGGCPAGATDIVPAGAISTIISPLSSNGGATLTHALPISSPALDAANLANCPTADQRGFLRGFNGVGAVNNPQVGDCDIGAFEFSLDPGYASTPAIGATLNFGSTPVGTEISSILEIRETGGASLSVSLDSITGANAGDFSIIGLPTAIGDTNPPQNIALICTPSASGLRTAQITFSTNDPMMPLVSYDLECIGTDNIVASASIVGINQVITEGATTVNVTVQLDVPAGFSDMGDVVVQITDAMTGNATSGADYTAFPATNITFAGPLTTGTYTNTVSVIVNILDDTAIEGAEALALEINSVTGAGEIGFPDTHTIVINDNDANIFAQASFVGNSAIINENAGTLTIGVQLFIPTGFNLTGNITLTISDSLGGIATSGTDYTAFAPPPVTFVDAPFVVGATYTQTVTLDILDDALTEGVETVDLGITGISGGVELISPAQFTVIINDDEIATVIVTQPGGTVTVPVGDPEFVFKTVDNPFASIGQTVTYTIRARNPKTIPLTQVVIYDVFDERLSDIRLISTTHGKEVFNGNTLTVSDFTLQPNEEAIIIVSAKVATLKVGDTIPNAAILESPDASVHVSNLALVGANATGNSGDASQVFVIPNQLPNTGENPGWRNVILWAGGFLLVLSAGLLIWGKRTKQHA